MTTLWAAGMPAVGNGQHWRHMGGMYYVDVTDKYVPVAEVVRLEAEVRRLNELLQFYAGTTP